MEYKYYPIPSSKMYDFRTISSVCFTLQLHEIVVSRHRIQEQLFSSVVKDFNAAWVVIDIDIDTIKIIQYTDCKSITNNKVVQA